MSNPLDVLIPTPPPPGPSFRWAIVTGISPLQITFDTETDPLEGSPSTLAPVVLGDRVFVAVVDNRATILGKAQ